MVVENRLRESHLRESLAGQLSALVRKHFGINVKIDMVKPGSLPRTTSGKLSRFQSREAYLEREKAMKTERDSLDVTLSAVA